MFLLTLCCLLAASSYASAACDACINSLCHKRVPVLTGYDQVGQIDIDRTSNIFYFHLQDRQRASFTCAYDLDNVVLGRIWDVDFTFARTVDQLTRDVYLSSHSTVYKANPVQNYTDFREVFEKTVWQMQFKDGKLFYTEFMSNGLKYFHKNEHKAVKALSTYKIDDFAIDKHDDIYFLTDFAIYRLKNGESKPNIFADEIYSLTTDKNGEAYFVQSFNKGFYKVDYVEDKLVEVGAVSVGTPFKAVFTSENNIIYSDPDFNGMYYLVPDSGTCKIGNIGAGKTARKTVSIDV